MVRAERCTRGAKSRTGQYRPAVTLNRAAVEFLKAMMVKVVVVVVQVVVVVVVVVVVQERRVRDKIRQFWHVSG